jgi:uncharacterized protein (DUF433 family)
LDLLADGATLEELLDDYPQLSREDVLACIAYGSEMSRERYVDRTGDPDRATGSRAAVSG